jgi:hypothetical protein
MGRKPDAVNLQHFLEELRQDLHRSLCSSTADLISALQERELERARGIAVQLFRDSHLSNNHRPSSRLSQIVSLLDSDEVFLNCDQLSVWLLELECELQQLRFSSPQVLPEGAMFPHARETSPDERLLWQSTGSIEMREPKKA